jgi:AraC family transcriptional regulator
MNSAVERAIVCIWERYGEPLSLTDIAQSAILSRFHFSRIFKDATGVPPGRFLSAVRIYQAKRMLATTSTNVTDISFAVGFNSLGSFTNHFTDSVGISPSRFRRLAQNGGVELEDLLSDSSSSYGVVTGTISLSAKYVGARVCLGAFNTPIVQRRPVAAIVADVTSAEPYSYRLTNIPEGEWFIHAVAVADTVDPEPWTSRTLLVGGCGPVQVGAEIGTRAEISLRARRSTDLPILFALPDLEPEADDLARPRIAVVPADGRVTSPAAS